MVDASPVRPVVLVIDDDPIAQKSLAVLLGNEGYQLVFADDGREGIERALSTSPDLILLDVVMPGMSGLAVLQVLRTTPVLEEVPVLMITALSDSDTRIKALELGADDFIHKPYDRIELRARLSSITRLNRFRKLHEERLRFDALLDQSPAGFLLVDRQLRVHRANRAMVRLLAAGGPGRLTGTSFEEMLAGSDRAMIAPFLESVLSCPDTDMSVELSMRRFDQTLFPAVLDARRVRWNDLDLAQIIVRDMSDIKRYQAELERTAYTDSLTQLPNQGLLADRLRVTIASAMRSEEAAAVLVIDFDRFHLLNEAFGFAEGDKVLVAMAERLRNEARPDETVARLSGSEFACVLRGFSNTHQVVTRAQTMLTNLAAPIAVDGQRFTVTASIGVAVFPRDATEPEELLKSATLAVRRAKAAGGNCVRYYAPDMEARGLLRLNLETRLRNAMKKDQLRLHYQPKVSLGSRMVCGAEALLRWTDDQQRAIPPDEFIPIAEETDLILGLGSWVMRRACEMIAERSRWHMPDLPVAINVSARQFQEQDVDELVRQVVNETHINPQLLHLEITERLLLEESGRVVHTLAALKNLGIKLALDDFGTGCSSLKYLKYLPLDYIKIDKCFVRGMQEDDRDQAMVESIVRMAHRLGFRVIAEGVENEWEARFLRELGCDEGQGYLFRRPMPEEEFKRLSPPEAEWRDAMRSA